MSEQMQHLWADFRLHGYAIEVVYTKGDLGLVSVVAVGSDIREAEQKEALPYATWVDGNCHGSRERLPNRASLRHGASPSTTRVIPKRDIERPMPSIVEASFSSQVVCASALLIC